MRSSLNEKKKSIFDNDSENVKEAENKSVYENKNFQRKSTI